MKRYVKLAALLAAMGGCDSASIVEMTGLAGIAFDSQALPHGKIVVRNADGTVAFTRVSWLGKRGLLNRFARMPDGRVLALSVAERELEETHLSKWGRVAIGPGVKGKPETGSRFVAMLESSGAARAFLHAASVVDPDARRQAPPELVFFSSDYETAIRLSRGSGVLKVLALQHEPEISKNGASWAHVTFPVATADWVPTSSLTTGSHESFGAKNIFGKSVKVGVLETLREPDLNGQTQPGCQLFAEHEAFSDLGSLTYRAPPLTCSTDADCRLCEVKGLAGKCIAGRCVDQHLSHVASRIASSQATTKINGGPTGPSHAAKVDIFVPSFTTRNWTALGLQNEYQWLDAQGVQLVSESIGVNNATSFNFPGVMADWYAWHRGMTFVKNAGNRVSGGPRETECGGLNYVCVGASVFPPTADPEATAEHFWLPSSKYKNFEGIEAEFPDVLAEGSNGHVADVNDPNSWDLGGGTSYATPTVLGLLALMQENCGTSNRFDSSYFRSAIRTFGPWNESALETAVAPDLPTDCSLLTAQTDPPLYPAPHLGCDHYGGAGVIHSKLLEYCPNSPPPPGCGTPGNPCPVSGSGILNPEVMGAIPSWLEGDEDEWYANSSRSALRQANGRFQSLFAFPSAARAQGTRIRATFSYFSCPASALSNSAVLGAANNLDFILSGVPVGGSSEQVVFAAQSYDDTDEGFDVRLMQDYSSLRLSVLGPSSWQSCPDANGAASPNEPFTWWAGWEAQ